MGPVQRPEGLDPLPGRSDAGRSGLLRVGRLVLVVVEHVLATALAGYTVAHDRYLLTALFVPFPLGFLYRRYTYAQPTDDSDG